MQALFEHWQTAWALLAGHRRFLVCGRDAQLLNRYNCIWARDRQNAIRRFARRNVECARIEVLASL